MLGAELALKPKVVFETELLESNTAEVRGLSFATIVIEISMFANIFESVSRKWLIYPVRVSVKSMSRRIQ